MPTQTEKKRMDQIASWGCLPCMLSRRERDATIQHVTEAGRRLGHMFTYGSCPWHHQGVKEDGYSRSQMMKLLGPSFAHSRRAFETRYGDEKNVLVRLQSWCLVKDSIPHHELISKWDHLRRMN